MKKYRKSEVGSYRRSSYRDSEYEQYVSGNTVRQYDWIREKEDRRRKTTDIKKQNQNVRKNRERALRMDLPYLLILVVAVAFSLYFFYTYLSVQTSITTSMRDIENNQKQLLALKNENDALEMSINAHIDLDNIYRLATEELGMVYAGSEQIIKYDRAEREQVRQYEEIPQR